MSTIKTLIFDMGNVLVFHDNAFLFKRMADRTGTKPELLASYLHESIWERVHRGELSADAIRLELCQRTSTDLSSAEFYELWNCHFTLNEAIFPQIEALAGKVQLILLSNTNDLHAQFLLPRLPILRYFEHLILSHNVALLKPDAAIFRYALQLSGAQPSSTAFVDDIPEYVDAAKRLGMHGIHFVDTASLTLQLSMLGL